MRYNLIRKMDISNGKGIGVSIFTQGCPIRCKGCFNKDTWDFNGGKLYTQETQDTILELIKPDYITKFATLGGETLLHQNIPDLLSLVKAIKEERPDIKIWCWTGQLYENLRRIDDWQLQELINNFDYLIDGPFIQEKKDLTLLFRGSSNQRIIDIKETQQQGKLTLANFEE